MSDNARGHGTDREEIANRRRDRRNNSGSRTGHVLDPAVHVTFRSQDQNGIRIACHYALVGTPVFGATSGLAVEPVDPGIDSALAGSLIDKVDDEAVFERAFDD